jgi:hypothetical protein
VLGQIFCFNARLYVFTRFIVRIPDQTVYKLSLTLDQLGFGAMLIIAGCPVLLTELAHPRYRSSLVAGYASLFFLGSVSEYTCLVAAVHRNFAEILSQ